MFKGRFFNSGGIWKPKNPHSLDYLKYLHGLLLKHETVTDGNRTLLVEAIRSISEILIWGDQNDPSVFDFFLEKNMLSFFLKILNQKCGSFVCVQLLQTLNILFENIRHETSLYYLLSNNYVNSIITHRYDFSDEEIMAYYISFLKTLSLKLNENTIHFFFNETTKDFPLYTEGIKFFNHSEGMVRIAVRTLTLNVWKVKDVAMLEFVRDRTAAPYFSNLVWFIGKHILDLEIHVAASDDRKRAVDMVESLVAEHLDHMHYLNDILWLDIDSIATVLREQLMGRLLLPLYLASLRPVPVPSASPLVSRVLSLFLLTQIFLIITHKPLVHQLLHILAFGSEEDFAKLQAQLKATVEAESAQSTDDALRAPMPLMAPLNATDEEKANASGAEGIDGARPFYSAILVSLNCAATDHAAFFALTLLYAISRNEGITAEVLGNASLSGDLLSEENPFCDRQILGALVDIIRRSCDKESRVRLVTVELACIVLRQVLLSAESVLDFFQQHLYQILIEAKENIVAQLVTYYKSDELFLDLFEDEYQQFQKSSLKINMVSTEPHLLLPPSSTPFSGVEFTKRLPCGAQEETRRAVRVHFLLRQLVLDLDGGSESRLPLSDPELQVRLDDCLNLNNSDLLSCTVVPAKSPATKVQRFLVADGLQLILVEPDSARLGWGVVRFVGFLQDVELSGDKEDSRVLCVLLDRPSAGPSTPALNARFIFDDHIRCMAAKQRLSKGRQKARQHKMELIADLLEIPPTLRVAALSGGRRGSPDPAATARWAGRAPGGSSRARAAKARDDGAIPLRNMSQSPQPPTVFVQPTNDQPNGKNLPIRDI